MSVDVDCCSCSGNGVGFGGCGGYRGRRHMYRDRWVSAGFPKEKGLSQGGLAGKGRVGLWRQGFRIREVPRFGWFFIGSMGCVRYYFGFW